MTSTQARLWSVDEYHRMIEAEILTLVEVADTTLYRDCKQKAPAYAKAKIPEYWVMDVTKKQVYVFREPREKAYQQETLLNEEATLSPLAFPDIEVQINQLFP